MGVKGLNSSAIVWLDLCYYIMCFTQKSGVLVMSLKRFKCAYLRHNKGFDQVFGSQQKQPNPAVCLYLSARP